MMGQLPLEQLAPGSVFDKTGLDYAGPFNIKYGYVRRPTIVKAYVCVFVSLTVKAVHLELVSDLTSEAFIACLRRFISRRGYPSMLWSDHGSNFIGAKREIKELLEFLNKQKTQKSISEFCSLNTLNGDSYPSTRHILVVFGKLQLKASRPFSSVLCPTSSSHLRKCTPSSPRLKPV